MNIREKILNLTRRPGRVTTRQVAESFGVSRAYAHKILRELQEEGLVILIGKTNQAHYINAVDAKALRSAKEKIRHIFLRLANRGLSEDAVLKRIESETGVFIGVPANVRQIVSHGFTEMLNNAIDHSRSRRIEVDVRRTSTAVTFVVRDFGIGVFNNVRDKFRLPGTLAAIQEILKGKATTAPQAHTGEGIFFTSKMADVFTIDSFEKRLTINNLLPDIFITDRKSIAGTRVSFSIHLEAKRTVEEVFGAFTGGAEGEMEFDRTSVTIKLFRYGRNLPSRSEAKRVVTNLEHFREVELDFSGVETVGQGFADEIFRVWGNRHPDTKIMATNANENVAFMIRRAGGEIGQERLKL
ncbi:MAG: hypothetical protein RL272_1044 [Candidatus Parcubacteria bacterium]|jgi:DNA-binding Lrp family transcriptional regulator